MIDVKLDCCGVAPRSCKRNPFGAMGAGGLSSGPVLVHTSEASATSPTSSVVDAMVNSTLGGGLCATARMGSAVRVASVMQVTMHRLTVIALPVFVQGGYRRWGGRLFAPLQSLAELFHPSSESVLSLLLRRVLLLRLLGLRLLLLLLFLILLCG